MVKRFTFESTAIGKQTGIISDENGSKLVLISGAKQPVVKVEQLKGKEQIPETIEVDLASLIDIKGMKAMGNRLSQQQIKKVELIPTIEMQEETIADDDNGLDELPEISDTASAEIHEAAEAKTIQQEEEISRSTSDQSVKSPIIPVESPKEKSVE